MMSLIQLDFTLQMNLLDKIDEVFNHARRRDRIEEGERETKIVDDNIIKDLEKKLNKFRKKRMFSDKELQ